MPVSYSIGTNMTTIVNQ